MTVGERGEGPRGTEISSGNIPIKRPKALLERVGIALGMAGRIVVDGPSFVVHQGRIAEVPGVQAIATADPQLLALLTVPGQCAILPGDLEANRALSSRRDL